MEELVPRTWVSGTPRVWGDAKLASEWINDIRKALNRYSGVGRNHVLSQVRYEVVLEFHINPDSPKYGGRMRPHGPDLGNFVKQTIDALAQTKSENMAEGLIILADDCAVYRIAATKEHVLDVIMGVLMLVFAGLLLGGVVSQKS